MTDEPSTTHFGYQEIPVADKVRHVGEVFDAVADRYDLMNDLMSLGIHRLWKRHAIRRLRLSPGHHALDLAGGTGDLARLMIEKMQHRGRVTLCDINAAMLATGRQRLTDAGLVDGIDWVQGDAERLPFPDNTFHAVTIGFGIRNVTRIEVALAEMVRVLRPGGQLLCLEFSRLAIPLLQPLYDAYSFKVLPELGARVANNREAYQYLAESIRRFPDQQTLKSMLERQGLFRVDYLNLAAGIAAIHFGFKV
ncbi:MAG: bifunctional demethylmenaquinone methyltransferase/2-methoxy-6-polyprenyl-1,4-benzoquinol methylase UbiE [Magnetococcales bacterium]|nr:bifunctional demethylmenaquinone methyltransferase/2-methoxy-6-polyprenyl-1,4-benzoquinol methylase UbiE [Magnetococcales bacterium]MBF0323372.1 bifunctional demethylmenaquinone methyltransferase/2-methoxy-6-polyprenyl-1,4-benzoquinol methylase UbiE [Magnetococcales bacterium]